MRRRRVLDDIQELTAISQRADFEDRKSRETKAHSKVVVTLDVVEIAPIELQVCVCVCGLCVYREVVVEYDTGMVGAAKGSGALVNNNTK